MAILIVAALAVIGACEIAYAVYLLAGGAWALLCMGLFTLAAAMLGSRGV